MSKIEVRESPLLRLGRWEDVLADIEVDAVVTDPPFSERVHTSEMERNDVEFGKGRSQTTSTVNGFTFEHWTPADVDAFVTSWSPRCRGWIVALTSHDLCGAYQDAYTDAGRYAFAPVPCVIRGMTVRLSGDGPSSWSVYAMVARPRDKSFLGGWTCPGAYVCGTGHAQRGKAVAGSGRSKPSQLEHALVRDYSRRGDLVCDPMSGYGGTLRAALALGRRAVGAEVDPEAYQRAKAALARPQQMDLLSGAPRAE